MRAGTQFIPRDRFGPALMPPAVRYAPELNEEAKTAWFTLALYAGVADADYPPWPALQRRFGFGRIRARRAIAQLEQLGLIEAQACAGSRKRRFVFLWRKLYEEPARPPRKPPARSQLEDVGSIIRSLA